jgi:hypothetical protein
MKKIGSLNKKFDICTIFVAVVLAIIIVLTIRPETIIKNKLMPIEDNSKVTYKGYSIDGNRYRATNKDPQIVISDYDVDFNMMYIDAASVKPAKNNRAINITMFYAQPGTFFAQEESLSGWLTKENLNCYIIPAHRDKWVGNNHIRVDVGSVKGDTFTLNGIYFVNRTVGVNAVDVAILLLSSMIMYVLLHCILQPFSKKIGKKNWPVFGVSLIAGELLFAGTLLITRSRDYFNYFHSNEYDSYMDHFNMLAANWDSNPYGKNVIYPPNCFLILKILYHFIPLDYINRVDALALRTYAISTITSFIFMIFVILIIFLLLRNSFDIKDEKYSKVMAWSLLFCGPMLFLFERGNIIILSLLGLIIYIKYYDSDDKRLRLLSYFGLAFSASIKIYPALFGFLTARKKRHKETLLLVIIGVVIFVVPSFFTGGMGAFIKSFTDGMSVAGVEQLMRGLDYNYSLTAFAGIVGIFLGKSIITVPGLLKLLFLLFGFVLFALSKKDWQRAFAMMMIIVWIPDFSYTYVLTLMIAPLILFMRSESHELAKGINGFYAFCFWIILCPFSLPSLRSIDRIGWVMPLSTTTLMVNIILALFTVVLTCNLIYTRFIRNVDKKE